MASENKIKLQGHEKFSLREGWINKALRAVPHYRNVFLEKDAPEIFGIGSNMVKSLRYWMRVLELTDKTGSELSPIGEIVKQYDEFVEDEFTLWLLHSRIAKKINEATTWYMYFNKCDADDLSKEDICSIISREINKYTGGQKISEKSLANDVDILLSMYSRQKRKDDPEDKSVSPFTRLRIVKNSNGKYSKCSPAINIFSEFIILYEIAELQEENQFHISIDKLINGETGLKSIYNLSEVMANELLDKLDAEGLVRVDRTAGIDLIYTESHFDFYEIIRMYYKNK